MYLSLETNRLFVETYFSEKVYTFKYTERIKNQASFNEEHAIENKCRKFIAENENRHSKNLNYNNEISKFSVSLCFFKLIFRKLKD